MIETVAYLRNKFKAIPEILIILGSAFGRIADKVTIENKLPYKDIPKFKQPTAPTHEGNLIVGKIAGKDVMVMQGRFHVYEGYDMKDTTYPIRVAAELGIRKMITTNLSGGINTAYDVGDFMVVEDHINFSGLNPLIWNLQEPYGKFTDMYEAYSPKMIELFEDAATELGINIHKGILAYVIGPNFETRAELKMLQLLGADAVGWSLVPEVLEARRCGIEVLGIVCISDLSKPDRFAKVNLEELYQTGTNKADVLFSLLEKFIRKT